MQVIISIDAGHPMLRFFLIKILIFCIKQLEVKTDEAWNKLMQTKGLVGMKYYFTLA